MRVNFPYDNVPALDIPDASFMGVFAAPEMSASHDIDTLVKSALDSPIGASRLSEKAKNAKSVLLVVDDITRPTPVDRILPHILDELSSAGVDDGQIEILLALGTHRFMTKEEIAKKIGEKVAARFRVHNHDWMNPDVCEFIGTTLGGVPVWMNKKVVQADLVVGVGLIMPIDISGFTGGGKILVPGTCGKITNDEMHWYRIDEPDERFTGRRDNAVRSAIDEMARKAGLDFIVNVIMDSTGDVFRVVAGDMVDAHREGCVSALEAHSVTLPSLADVVVADSYPFDIEFWQANKALDQAAMAVRKGGSLILVTPCPEGFSATHEQIREIGYPPVDQIKSLVATGKIKSKVVAVHMVQVSKVARERANVIVVTDGISERDLERVGLGWAATPQDALDRAFEIVGRDGKVAVLRGAAEMLPLTK